jgi:hypothetical protein
VNERLLLRSLRATLASAASQLDALEQVLAEREGGDEPSGCEHPRRTKKVATMDNPARWMCEDCGFIGGEKEA